MNMQDFRLPDCVSSQIDTSKTPDIYRTSNRKYYKKLAVDFQPQSIPTICPFENLTEIKAFCILNFGEEKWNEWFPNGFGEVKDGCVELV